MRLQNAILLFQQRGVLASANVWKEDKRVQLVGSQEHPNISFAAMEDILEEGKPVIGGFTICDDDRFRTLGRNEVYTSNADLNAACGTYDHLVVFIGSGSEAKKPFLVFLNSEGVQFGKNGYGKVLFTQARAFRTLDLESVLQQQSPPPSPSRKRSLDASNSSSSSPVGSMIWKSDPRKKRYRSSCSNPGGSDVLTDSNEFLSVSLEGETKEMDTVKTDRIDKDEDGSCSSSDDDMTEDRSSSEEEKSNDEMNGSDDEDEETPKKLVVCKRVAETALKESVSHKKAKSLASDKEAKIAAPSGCKTGDKKGVETHSTKKVNQAPANS